ncbi:MAG: SPOR domain-containing protein [Gammaproteobacteria bacterium]|nr:SPOR domain-containing protein [Gammaproteobacteria bacterium]
MAPILIDNRGIIKLSFVAVIGTALVFSSGFILGYQQAKTYRVASSESEPLPLPVKNASLASDVEQQRPKVVDAGEMIDVDQPEVVINSVKVITDKTPSIKKSEILTSTSDVNKSSVDKTPPVVIDSQKDLSPQNVVNSEPDLITNDVLDQARYSIQVGLYGRLTNAEKMVEKLQLQNLNAYVSDHVNKKNEVRFNVRFGYFSDKKTAISALKKYREDQKGDGYLVNFSMDSLTHFASTKNVDLPVEVVQNPVNQSKVTDADTIDTPNVLIKTQAENSEGGLIRDADKIIYN